MAYPTTLNFKSVSPFVGAPQGPGQSFAGGVAGGTGFAPDVTNRPDIPSTLSAQRNPLGQKHWFTDSKYGEIECIYLQCNIAVNSGDIVIYDAKAGTIVKTVAASRGPVAVSMQTVTSAQASAAQGAFGWFAVRGKVPVNTTAAGTGAANSGLKVTATAGQATVAAGVTAGDIDGCICQSAQDGPGVGFTDVLLMDPFTLT